MKKNALARPRAAISRALNDVLQEAVALQSTGTAEHLELARQRYVAILEQHPAQFDALHMMGVMAAQGRDFQTALNYLHRALEQQPKHPDALRNRATAYAYAGQWEAAEKDYTDSYALDSNPLTRFMLGDGLRKMGYYERALPWLAESVKDFPEDAGVWQSVGVVLREMGDLEQAEKAMAWAMQLEPENHQIWHGLAGVYVRQGRFEEAMPLLNRVLEKAPQYEPAYTSRGIAWQRMGQWQQARQDFERAVELVGHKPHAQANLALIFLQEGDYSQGWLLYEHRLCNKALQTQRPPADKPRWRSGMGGRVLVWTEQGLGDFVQFLRFVPLLHAAGAQVILRCPDAMLEMLQGFSGVTRFCAAGQPWPEAHEYDSECPIMSLPLALGLLEGVALFSAAPYLHAEEEKVQAWAAQLGKVEPVRGLRIGVVCSGNPALPHDPARSIALARMMQHLPKDRGWEYHYLQNTVREGDKNALLQTQGLHDHREKLTNFAQTAALCACMDIVVSVDTSVAHLAGALGRPLLLLISYVPDWRWGLQGEQTPWYPSMTVLRQKTLNDWDEVLQRVPCAIEQRLLRLGSRP